MSAKCQERIEESVVLAHTLCMSMSLSLQHSAGWSTGATACVRHIPDVYPMTKRCARRFHECSARQLSQIEMGLLAMNAHQRL